MGAKSSTVVHFGGERGSTLGTRLAHVQRRQRVESVCSLAADGAIGALVLDARTPAGLLRASGLLRALFDDPIHPRRVLHPGRVLALIPAGDVEAAFVFGRYGIAGVIQDGDPDLAGQVGRVVASAPEAPPLPIGATLREARLAPRREGELPTVTIGFRHAPETLTALDRYCRVLREHAGASTVFADVSTAIEVMVREGLTCQTNLAAKAGAAHGGQFIGSFAYYRQLRRTRYAKIPDHPGAAIAMDVFIAVDEVLHEVLHLLFLANALRARIEPRHAQIAEELSLTWWQAVVHNRVFPEWLRDRNILEINDDFIVNERNQEGFHFWAVGHVFDNYLDCPWVPYVIAQLPERECYIGQRADFGEVVASLEARPEAAFLLPRERLAMDVPFDSYPRTPPSLSLA